ncbi:MAG: exonuclease domain-containing protein [Bacteroidetes bacterium]|nr:exonuclease domain-containing protein [Bacteroidota bacterium]MCL5737352.1 exonuclease domain-containing protein [Bacteroidota bacterium]
MFEIDSNPSCSFHDAVFSVVDVETTGLMPALDKIIEFAAFKVQRGKIIEEYATLINPGRPIPNFIRNMTGISNEMVYDAPSFREIAVKVKDFLNGTVFTAHNSQFDYAFVRNELTAVGLEFDIPQLCTRKLSSRIFTQLPRKALDQVCHYLGIKINGRHRAFGDARATAHLLIELLELISERHEVVCLDELLRFQSVPHRIDPHKNQNVFKKAMTTAPNAPGIYRVYNAGEEIIYVGKAKNLKLRIASYLTKNPKDADKVRTMLSEAERLEWETTSSELHALLKELQLIRQYKPALNSQLINSRRFPFIKISSEKKYDRLDIVYELGEDGRYYGPFESSFIAEQVLSAADKYFKLVKCDKDFAEPFDPCLYFYIERCAAPCKEDVSYDEYNSEVEAVEEFLSGSFEKLTSELRIRLDELSKKLEFEEAAEARDLIEILERTSSRLKLLNGPIEKANFVCGWLSAGSGGRGNRYELYKVTRGLLSDPVVVSEDEFEPGLSFLMKESAIISNDFVPLRILLNHALRNPNGFFRVALNGKMGEDRVRDKIKTAAENYSSSGS